MQAGAIVVPPEMLSNGRGAYYRAFGTTPTRRRSECPEVPCDACAPMERAPRPAHLASGAITARPHADRHLSLSFLPPCSRFLESFLLLLRSFRPSPPDFSLVLASSLCPLPLPLSPASARSSVVFTATAPPHDLRDPRHGRRLEARRLVPRRCSTTSLYAPTAPRSAPSSRCVRLYRVASRPANGTWPPSPTGRGDGSRPCRAAPRCRLARTRLVRRPRGSDVPLIRQPRRSAIAFRAVCDATAHDQAQAGGSSRASGDRLHDGGAQRALRAHRPRRPVRGASGARG